MSCLSQKIQRQFFRIIFFVVVHFSVGSFANVNIMAPLFIGDPNNKVYLQALVDRKPTPYEDEWNRFREDLRLLKARGITGVSIDVWWGVVQRLGRDVYDWSYYRRLLELLQAEGMTAKVILSTHQCGANVGDNVRIQLPPWIWSEIYPDNHHQGAFVSEAGNRSHEYISYWSTEVALPYYESFWGSFLAEFRDLASSISAISVSLGPSGELHFPAYHQHDEGYGEEARQYPGRGIWQGSSRLARTDYHDFLREKFKTIDELNKEWGTQYRNFGEVYIPRDLKTPESFSNKLHSEWIDGPEADTLFDWYHDSLLQHLRLTLTRAAHLIWRDKDFGAMPISIKIPGVHWEKDRHAELMNGLISLRGLKAAQAGKWPEAYPVNDLGYAPIFETVADIQKAWPGHRFTVFSTAGSTPDQNVHPVSRGQAIIRAQAAIAAVLGIDLGLENALAGDLWNGRLDVLDSNFDLTQHRAITLLRMGDVVRNERALARCETWLEKSRDAKAAPANDGAPPK
jgi:beta-amylase